MRLVAAALMVLTVAGCALPPGDMTENRYSDVPPKLTNKAYAGLWTGTSGPYSMSLRIDADGRGVSCTSSAGAYSVDTIKLAGDTLYFQDGSSMTLTYAEGYLYGLPPNAGMQNLRLVHDNGLVAASSYCRARLQEPYL
jgi:hypothetical protein